MKRELLLNIVLIALVITFNSDLKIYWKAFVYFLNAKLDFISIFIFGGKGNICRL